VGGHVGQPLGRTQSLAWPSTPRLCAAGNWAAKKGDEWQARGEREASFPFELSIGAEGQLVGESFSFARLRRGSFGRRLSSSKQIGRLVDVYLGPFGGQFVAVRPLLSGRSAGASTLAVRS